MTTSRILHGDCIELLATLPAESIDALVTDPPYGIGFMGREWDTFKPGKGATRKLMHPRERMAAKIVSDNPNIDGRHRSPALSPSQIDYDYSVAGLRAFQGWCEQWGVEVLRVLKPGGYAVVCGAPRAYHRMASGLEDAGFEIRDCLAWLFGSGFPKSLNLGEGLGTALKPAHEPIVLARKPFKGTVAANVARFGTGALNIDAARIKWQSETDKENGRPASYSKAHDGFNGEAFKSADRSYRDPVAEQNDLGRWPANVCLDEYAALVLDEQSGERVSAGGTGEASKQRGGVLGWTPSNTGGFGDVGGASRFYYVAKPSREERDYGCGGLNARSSFETVSRDPSSAGANNPRAGSGRTSVLNTCEIVYNVAWVDAVLSRRLPADTDTSRRKAIAGSTTLCSDGSVWSMCWCGSPSTDPYHPVVRSIIETETSSITELTTSNLSRRPHTNGCMAAAFGVTAAGGNLAAYAEFQSPWKRATGTSPKKAGPSTADVNLATSIASWLTSEPVGGGRRVEAARNFHPT